MGPNVKIYRYINKKKQELWYSAGQTGHGESRFKQFKMKEGNLEWEADPDEYGDYMLGKHKGPSGRVMPTKSLKCWDAKP